MTRTVYVNGSYQPYAHALVHAEDRGFQFGDAVYEVCELHEGKIVDVERHLARLGRSLRELDMRAPLSDGAWRLVIGEVIRRNRVRDGLVYLQVSRGAAPRNFLFPTSDVPMTVVCLARSTKRARGEVPDHVETIAVKSVRDIRWGRCDIKTVMLLPASIAKEEAKTIEAQEAWLVDGSGNVTEGASSNAWIVTKNGEVVTRHADHEILRGVTRTSLIDAITAAGLTFTERTFSLEEAKAAKEAFITSATNPVTPVFRIDQSTIGNGEPGELTLRLRQLFRDGVAMEKL